MWSPWFRSVYQSLKSNLFSHESLKFSQIHSFDTHSSKKKKLLVRNLLQWNATIHGINEKFTQMC